MNGTEYVDELVVGGSRLIQTPINPNGVLNRPIGTLAIDPGGNLWIALSATGDWGPFIANGPRSLFRLAGDPPEQLNVAVATPFSSSHLVLPAGLLNIVGRRLTIRAGIEYVGDAIGTWQGGGRIGVTGYGVVPAGYVPGAAPRYMHFEQSFYVKTPGVAGILVQESKAFYDIAGTPAVNSSMFATGPTDLTGSVGLSIFVLSSTLMLSSLWSVDYEVCF